LFIPENILAFLYLVEQDYDLLDLLLRQICGLVEIEHQIRDSTSVALVHDFGFLSGLEDIDGQDVIKYVVVFVNFNIFC